MVVERPPSSAPFQQQVDWWIANEQPKNDAFEAKLKELRTAFAKHELDEPTFIKRLIAETQPCNFGALLANQEVRIERTEDGKIKITRNDVLSSVVPVLMQAILEIDEEGRLDVIGNAQWIDLESGASEKVEGDTITTDIFLIGVSQQEWANSYAYALLGIELPPYVAAFELDDGNGLVITPEQDPFRED